MECIFHRRSENCSGIFLIPRAKVNIQNDTYDVTKKTKGIYILFEKAVRLCAEDCCPDAQLWAGSSDEQQTRDKLKLGPGLPKREEEIEEEGREEGVRRDGPRPKRPSHARPGHGGRREKGPSVKNSASAVPRSADVCRMWATMCEKARGRAGRGERRCRAASQSSLRLH